MIKSILPLLIVVFLLQQIHSEAQKASKIPLFKERGILMGAGQGIDSMNVPEGNYTPLFFIAHFGMDLLRNSRMKQTNCGIFTIYFEPQINFAFIRNPETTTSTLEGGVNVGFQHMYPIFREAVYAYILIATGPHYFTAHTAKQARGFLFSDNLGTGLYLFSSRNIAINLGFRLRHLSNGELIKPNHGINTFNYHIGISKIIR